MTSKELIKKSLLAQPFSSMEVTLHGLEATTTVIYYKGLNGETRNRITLSSIYMISSYRKVKK